MEPIENLLAEFAYQRWVDDGGKCPLEPDGLESKLDDLTILRVALLKRADDPSDVELLMNYVAGFITASSFGKPLGLHRSNGLRRLQKALANFSTKLHCDPTFRAEIPARFHHLLPDH